jgi:hypothetical protein
MKGETKNKYWNIGSRQIPVLMCVPCICTRTLAIAPDKRMVMMGRRKVRNVMSIRRSCTASDQVRPCERTHIQSLFCENKAFHADLSLALANIYDMLHHSGIRDLARSRSRSRSRSLCPSLCFSLSLSPSCLPPYISLCYISRIQLCPAEIRHSPPC